MSMIQHSPLVFTASPASMHPTRPAPMRPALPDRNVDGSSIEDAFVAFILACNPAVPLETDTAALREAFRTPPKSGGKSFSTYLLFELIKQLETKELKTWGELALKLGVEPPDEEKRESSQKIQQYAVRLKRWMHSMHVDAFFEYLMDRPSPYWTEIPSEHTPLSEVEREGVAAEDDMALRSLLPHIKPRRGRRKFEDDEPSKSPSQRPSPQPDRQGEMDPWTAQPDRGSVFLFPPVPDPSRLNASGPSWASDLVQTPMTAYPHPQSAITPSTRASFWADEPKSAITPSKRLQGKRHGAKAVSSAWRRGGLGSGGKARGRPPMNRGVHSDGPFSAFLPGSDVLNFKLPSPTPEASAVTSAPIPAQASADPAPAAVPAPPLVSPQQQAQSPVHPSPVESVHSRPAKRSRLSLQVPERVGGQVRLATPPLPDPPPPSQAPPPPPPVVMINGLATTSPSNSTPQPSNPQHNQGSAHSQPSAPPPPPQQQQQQQQQSQQQQQQQQDSHTFISQYTNHFPQSKPYPPYQFPRVSLPLSTSTQSSNSDTHMAELYSVFVGSLLRAKWLDAQGQPAPPCTPGEAWTLSEAVVNNLRKSAASKEAFLINLAALAGGSILMPQNSLRVNRLGPAPDGKTTRYKVDWKLVWGEVQGDFSMEEEVDILRPEEARSKKQQEQQEIRAQANDWENRYRELEEVLRRKEDEMSRLKGKILDGLRQEDEN